MASTLAHQATSPGSGGSGSGSGSVASGSLTAATSTPPSPSPSSPNHRLKPARPLSINVPSNSSFIPPPRLPHWADAQPQLGDAPPSRRTHANNSTTTILNSSAAAQRSASGSGSGSASNSYSNSPDSQSDTAIIDTQLDTNLAPSTPITLPPASLADQSDSGSPPASPPPRSTSTRRQQDHSPPSSSSNGNHHQLQQRQTSFPSESDELEGVGLGLGQHLLRIRDSTHDRSQTRPVGPSGTEQSTGLGISEIVSREDDEEEEPVPQVLNGWKDSVLREDLAVGVAISTAEHDPVGRPAPPNDTGPSPLPFPTIPRSQSTSSVSYHGSPLHRDLPPLPPPGIDDQDYSSSAPPLSAIRSNTSSSNGPPPFTSTPTSTSTSPSPLPRSVRRSNATTASSTATSSNSSTLSLPSAPPVDLALPSHNNNRAPGSGTFVSVASGPMARLNPDNAVPQRSQSRGPRAFFSNLLSRSPRSPNLLSSSPSSPSLSSSSPPPPSQHSGFTGSRSPSAPAGFFNSPPLPSTSAGNQTAAQRSSAFASTNNNNHHQRSNSLPASPDARSVRSFGGPGGSSSPNPSSSNPRGGGGGSSPLVGYSRTATPGGRESSDPLPTSQSMPFIGGGVSSMGTPPQNSPSPSMGAGFSPFLAAAAGGAGRSAPSSPNPSGSSSRPGTSKGKGAAQEQSTPSPPSLEEIGLGLVPLTQPLSLSRNSQPLCGALLDDKYILIGTAGGLDFLPIPLPGSLPMKSHGKKRRETRKPISLIKRTRFKEIAVLSERSNILLAIAGRNDHIRVYALDGIRAMIEKKMAELDVRDGYPIIPDPAILSAAARLNGKGKGKAEPAAAAARAPSPRVSTFPPRPSTLAPTAPPLAPPSASQPSTSSDPFHFPTTSPPPDYSAAVPPSPAATISSTRRRPPPLNQSSLASASPHLPSSPIRPSARMTPTVGHLVRAIPTNPRSPVTRPGSVPSSPRTLRGQKSREFVASRRGSTAVIQKRKSRADMTGDSASVSAASRRSSVVSVPEDDRPTPRRGSLADSTTTGPPGTIVGTSNMLRRPSLGATLSLAGSLPDEVEDGGDEADDDVPRRRGSSFLSPIPGPVRRASASSAGESGWATDPSLSPDLGRASSSRMEARESSYSSLVNGGTTTSPSLELAEFLRSTGPSSDVLRPPPASSQLSLPDPDGSPKSTFSSRFGPKSQSSRDLSGSGWAQEALENAQRANKLRRAPPQSGDDHRRSSTRDLVDLFKSNPFDGAGSTSGVPAFQNKKAPREPTSPPLRQGERSPNLELADVIRNSGPDDSLRQSETEDSSTYGGASSTHGDLDNSSTAHLLGLGDSPAGGSSSARSRSPSIVVNGTSQHPAMPPMLPRDASFPRLAAHERSPVMELAELIRETGPPRRDSFPTAGPFPARARTPEPANRREPERRASTVAERRASITTERRLSSATQRQNSSGSLEALPAPGGLQRSVSARARLIARSPHTRKEDESEGEGDGEDVDDEDVPRRRGSGMTLAEAIRDGPPPGFTASSSTTNLPSSASAPTLSAGASSPGTRASKRWTMSGMGSLFLNRPGSSEGPNSAQLSPSRRASMETRRSSLQLDPAAEPSASAVDAVPVVSPTPPPPPPPPRTDQKRTHHSSLHPDGPPSLPASSQVPPDAHPANSSSPLEYVKLARTKGARLLRAVETKKRTYLAVLCGDEGERIELFTGSRSISLSLNRTFVLPEHPKTIEFQIQGDDLIDIYLVYPESIFALEPATVRVREVGVGRGERRARRERERRLREIASTAEPSATSTEPSPLATLHPADPALAEPPEEDATIDIDRARGPELGSRSTSPSPSPASRSATGADNATPPPSGTRQRTTSQSLQRPPGPTRTRSSDGAEEAPPVPPRSKSSLPYSTFQQLPFVPPVPSSVLASAWIIPPLYTDVVGGDGPSTSATSPPTQMSGIQPSITVTGEPDLSFSHFQPPPNPHDYPLLSPISLLGGAAQRANGPPGLFFVSRGRNLSGIVTGDGRSVIKKPLVWSMDKGNEGEQVQDVYRRIEVLIVRGTQTVVMGVGSSEVKAIAVGGGPGEPPFGTAASLTPTSTSKSTEPREVIFLGTHAASNQLFFTERVGQASWRTWCVAAKE
ncbi:hypothetical protein T439DRAFT_320630 [Meredithblackwellia eburnea MCA 4105]